MSDKLNFDSYKTELNKIKLTGKQKEVLMLKMHEAQNEKSVIKKGRGNNLNILQGRWTKVIAASLVVALICGWVYFSAKPNQTDITAQKNSFKIVASALKSPSLPDDAIGMYSGESGSGFIMLDTKHHDSKSLVMNNSYLNKDGKKDYFVSHKLTDLKIVGSNIKSVTMKSNQNSCYFNLSVFGEELNSFSNYDSLNNSQYTQKEFDDHADGLYSIFCDSFTYTAENPSLESQVIDLSEIINYVVESNRTDSEIDGWIDEIIKAMEESLTIRKEKHMQYGDDVAIPVSDRENELDLIMNNCISNMLEKTLRGASIDVTITFMDGTAQTKRINVDFIMMNADEEIVFDSATDDFSSFSDYDDYLFSWVAFRYAK